MKLSALGLSFVSVAFFPLLASAQAGPPQLEQGRMVFYDVLRPVPRSQLQEIPDPASLGGTVLEGNPRAFIRVDYGTPAGLLAGIFEVTRGKIRIVYPFTEHATIITGFVRITDESGFSKTYGPGDSYLIKRGSTVIWETLSLRVQKSFLNFVD